ncbi:MAG: permease [Micavibrio sp.]|nr:permease [Micavibrio sp.]
MTYTTGEGALAADMGHTSNTANSAAAGFFKRHGTLILLLAIGAGILCTFWFGSRYPALLKKVDDLPTYHPHSFVYSSELMTLSADDALWRRVLATFVNWVWSMRIGMTFGLSMGALLHTLFQIFPLKATNSVYLNTLKGIFVGVPAGVCVNCAVPVACGITRAKSKVETALGFMLSSPTLNIIVVSMIITAFPWQFAVVHFGLVAVVLLGVLPLMVKYMHNDATPIPASMPAPIMGDIPLPRLSPKEALKAYGMNLWKLVKTAVPMMLCGAIFSAVAVQVIPFDALFAHVGFMQVAATSMISTLLPAPIAMEVLVAHHLYLTQVPAAYVALFLSTLGSYSILPMIYLWREVSRKLAVGLYAAFVTLGIAAAYILQALLAAA